MFPTSKKLIASFIDHERVLNEIAKAWPASNQDELVSKANAFSKETGISPQDWLVHFKNCLGSDKPIPDSTLT